MKKIGILGCGWLGERVAANLQAKGYVIFTTNRSEAKRAAMHQKGYQAFKVHFPDQAITSFPTPITIAQTAFSQLDTIIISLPLSRKATIATLRIRFQNLIAFLSPCLHQQFFFFSSTGIYPNNNTILTESCPRSLLKEKIAGMEQLLQEHFPKLNILRLGGLFGEDRVFSKYFSNKIVQPSNQVVNHVHYKDIVAIMERLIQQQVKGSLYNVVAPKHPTKAAILTAQQQKYPYAPPLQLLAVEHHYKIVSSKQLIQDLNYTFQFPNPTEF